MSKRSKDQRHNISKKWQQRFLELTDKVASWSKDRSTKIASVIIDDNKDIVSFGYNGFPRGVNDDINERHERPTKYLYTEHGERNAIYSAAKKGVALKGLTLCTRWFPCADCTRAIIQSGLKKIICEKPMNTEKDRRWEESFKVSKTMLKEAEIEIIYYDK